ncbi:MAG: response regulator transcription factor [Bacteroidota bacterium]
MELVLVLDDEPAKGRKIESAIRDAGYECKYAINLTEARSFLKNENVTLGVFDISLENIAPDLTSIDFVIKEVQPKIPTLFITQHVESKYNEYFDDIVKRLPHASWIPMKEQKYLKENVLRGITLAKEKFKLFEYKENRALVKNITFQNKITFKERQAGRVDRDENPAKRLFLNKDDILYITSDDTESNTVKIVTTETSYFLTSGIGAVAKQLSLYQPIGYNFLRVQKSYIVNTDKIEYWDTQNNLLWIAGSSKIPVGSSFLKEQNLSDLFPFLPSD